MSPCPLLQIPNNIYVRIHDIIRCLISIFRMLEFSKQYKDNLILTLCYIDEHCYKYGNMVHIRI